MRSSKALLFATSLITLALATPLQAKPDNHSNQGHNKDRDRHQDTQHDQHDDYIDLDTQLIRSVFRDHQEYIDNRNSLPPGIRKNLARGKPIPPGIAKQIDPRLNQRLPHYDGYDWRQAGEDAVLISVTTGIIEAIISNAFD